MPTCAFTRCGDADECCLLGGCVARRFPGEAQQAPRDPELPASEALNGTKPGRPVRDPVFTSRRRKALR